MSGFDMGPIPVTAIITYCRDLCMMTCPVEIGRVVKVVILLDNVEREHHGRIAAKH